MYSSALIAVVRSGVLDHYRHKVRPSGVSIRLDSTARVHIYPCGRVRYRSTRPVERIMGSADILSNRPAVADLIAALS